MSSPLSQALKRGSAELLILALLDERFERTGRWIDDAVVPELAEHAADLAAEGTCPR